MIVRKQIGNSVKCQCAVMDSKDHLKDDTGFQLKSGNRQREMVSIGELLIRKHSMNSQYECHRGCGQPR